MSAAISIVVGRLNAIPRSDPYPPTSSDWRQGRGSHHHAPAPVSAAPQALPEGTLHEALKSGVVLCNAVNAIKPGVCKAPFTGSMAFKQMENIANFSTACESLGVPKFSLFQTVTLYENKDMGAVLLTLQALGSAAQKVPGYSGPALGAKPSDANVRQFTPEQLAAGKASQTFVGRGSTGTSGSAQDSLSARKRTLRDTSERGRV